MAAGFTVNVSTDAHAVSSDKDIKHNTSVQDVITQQTVKNIEETYYPTTTHRQDTPYTQTPPITHSNNDHDDVNFLV